MVEVQLELILPRSIFDQGHMVQHIPKGPLQYFHFLLEVFVHDLGHMELRIQQFGIGGAFYSVNCYSKKSNSPFPSTLCLRFRFLLKN